MLKWLRSWFTLRFSLTRLIIAIVFLGAFVGLNMREIGPVVHGEHVRPIESPHYLWGWPLPFIEQKEAWDQTEIGRWLSAAMEELQSDRMAVGEFMARFAARAAADRSRLLPWTHPTYRVLELESLY